ncbi:MAG: MATE family efflux transporter [Treponema sp.]|nr:MATE family efflux transporter [Treponema sp.]
MGVSLSSNEIFSSREFYRKLASLVLPIAFQSFMVSVVGASDALMLARLDQTALSAVSLATQVLFIANLFFGGFNAGLSIFAAQYWGKGDMLSIEKVFAYVLRSTLAVSLVFSLLTLFCPSLLMGIYTKDADLVREGSEYLRIVSPSFIFSGISFMYQCIFKNSERALVSTVISSTCVLLNVVLNAVMIYGLLGFPMLGIRGAALATSVARLVELLWTLGTGWKKSPVKLRAGFFFSADKVLVRDFWKYSYPVFMNQIVWGAGFSMYSVIMGHLGSDAVAANSIANIVKNLVTCFSIGLASGSGIMVGNELGRGRLDRAKIYGSKICHAALAIGALMGGVIFLLIPIVSANVSMSDEALHYLKWMLIMTTYNMIGKSSNTTTNCGIFPAGGDAKFSMICDIIDMWVIAVPAGLVSAFVFHLPVLWVFFIINLDEMIKLPAIYLYYTKYRWLKNLTR